MKSPMTIVGNSVTNADCPSGILPHQSPVIPLNPPIVPYQKISKSRIPFQQCQKTGSVPIISLSNQSNVKGAWPHTVVVASRMPYLVDRPRNLIPSLVNHTLSRRRLSIGNYKRRATSGAALIISNR